MVHCTCGLRHVIKEKGIYGIIKVDNVAGPERVTPIVGSYRELLKGPADLLPDSLDADIMIENRQQLFDLNPSFKS
jgi:hypothetical protein